MATETVAEAIKRVEAAKLAAVLPTAANDAERAALLAHATEPGECDAEYCPWGAYKESLCIRSSTHHRNCRCPDCCSMDDELDY